MLNASQLYVVVHTNKLFVPVLVCCSLPTCSKTHVGVFG